MTATTVPALDVKKSFGCKCDGTTNDTKGLQAALIAGKGQGQPVFIPGQCNYDDVLTLDGVRLFGDPKQGSALYALNPLRSAIYLIGNGPQIESLRLNGVTPTQRGTERDSCRVVAYNAHEFLMRNLIVTCAAGAGLRADASTAGVIELNEVSNTLADSIHVTDGSQSLTISHNRINASGDDGIAVVSYAGQVLPVRDIVAEYNRVSNNRGGRSMSIVGGEDIIYSLNMLMGNATSAGIYIAQEKGQTRGVKRARIERNTVHNCGAPDPKRHFGIMCFSDGDFPNEDITIRRNLIVQDAALGGIRCFGQQARVSLDRNIALATPPFELVGVPANVSYDSGPVGIDW